MDTERQRLAAGMICAGFTPEHRHVIEALIDQGLGAVILFSRNITGGPAQVAQLVAELKSRAGPRPLLVCIDHEGGRVSRMREGFTPLPSMREVGREVERAGDFSLARDVGRIMGRELRAVGFDLNFAPVADVDTNPDNPVIGDRSLSRNPLIVARAAAEIVRGLQEEGVAACCKHFPGHGDTSVDSHFGLPIVEHDLARLEKVELSPFRAGIEAGVAGLMTAHVIAKAIDPHRPATISRPVLQDMLRGKLGFKGVIVSDDFEMQGLAGHFAFEEAVIQGVVAGLDLLCICHTPERQRQAIELIASNIPEARLLESARRLENLSRRFARGPGEGVDPAAVGTSAHRAIVAKFKNLSGEIDPTEAWRK
jgi:beta-N-acetylhexosaminidase